MAGREYDDDEGVRQEQPERDGDHTLGRWVMVRKEREDDDE